MRLFHKVDGALLKVPLEPYPKPSKIVGCQIKGLELNLTLELKFTLELKHPLARGLQKLNPPRRGLLVCALKNGLKNKHTLHFCESLTQPHSF